MEGCAAISIVSGPEFSSMRGNDGTADRKAQPHSLGFCREESLEDLFFFVSSTFGVGGFDKPLLKPDYLC